MTCITCDCDTGVLSVMLRETCLNMSWYLYLWLPVWFLCGIPSPSLSPFSFLGLLTFHSLQFGKYDYYCEEPLAYLWWHYYNHWYFLYYYNHWYNPHRSVSWEGPLLSLLYFLTSSISVSSTYRCVLKCLLSELKLYYKFLKYRDSVLPFIVPGKQQALSICLMLASQTEVYGYSPQGLYEPYEVLFIYLFAVFPFELGKVCLEWSWMTTTLCWVLPWVFSATAYLCLMMLVYRSPKDLV